LPVLFVCENNGWSEFSPTSRQFVASILDLAAAFGIEAEQVDGNDVEAVASAGARQVAAIRAGGGPRLIECITRRVRGHYEGDPQKYRDDTADPGSDPLARSRVRLLAMGSGESQLDEIEAEVGKMIDAAVNAARAAPQTDFAAALAGVYTQGAG
jgi:pyruvate dehydrogenase E1 component alpha subunit